MFPFGSVVLDPINLLQRWSEQEQGTAAGSCQTMLLCVSRLVMSAAPSQGACDMVELGLIHSRSLAGSGIPIVM